MANYTIRCNLSAAQFPLATEMWGRTIIVPQYDQNYDYRSIINPDNYVDKGIPQVFYLHNTLPTSTGFQAISYTEVAAGFAGASDFDAAFPIQSEGVNQFIFVPSQGKNYIYDKMAGGWASVSPLAPGTAGPSTLVTTAFIHGKSLIFYEKDSCWTYDDTTKLLTAVVFTGIDITQVSGICSSAGYLVAWDKDTISWSSSSTETDFTPSIITGAGGGLLSEAKGAIVCCLPISNGFMVYCEKNVVSAKYSGNIQFPFIFFEVPGSGGISFPEQVSWQSNILTHYAYTSNGLQALDKTSASTILPEVTDFFATKLFEDFDETTESFTSQYLEGQMRPKLTVVGSRFFILSYGLFSPDYTHALVYDIILKKWGKLKIDHRDVFEWNFPSLYGGAAYNDLASVSYDDLSTTSYNDFGNGLPALHTAKDTIAFLQNNGNIKIVNFSLKEKSANGVFVLGKIQLQRNKWIIHLTTDIETIKTANAFSCKLLPSLNGKTFLRPVSMFEDRVPATSLNKVFKKQYTSMNFSLLLQGAFNLTSILVQLKAGGIS